MLLDTIVIVWIHTIVIIEYKQLVLFDTCNDLLDTYNTFYSFTDSIVSNGYMQFWVFETHNCYCLIFDTWNCYCVAQKML